MIHVKNVSKSFGPKRAVDEVTFHVDPGEVLGFLGPNGAGKSTTMRMVTGFLPVSSGTITVGGYDISEEPVTAKRLMGYLPENAPCYPDMTVTGFLKFCAEMRGFRGAERDRAVDRSIGMCFLERVRHQSVDTLSKGYRHRTCFAQSIIHDPEILIMDEPTDGLDPNQKHEVRTLIREMGKKKAIIFSTHILEEVEAVCSRAIIIDRGRIVANGTPAELKERSKQARLLKVCASGPSAETLSSAIATIDGVVEVEVFRQDGKIVELLVQATREAAKSETFPAEVAGVVFAAKGSIHELRRGEGRLDDVFRSITLPDTVAPSTESR